MKFWQTKLILSNEIKGLGLRSGTDKLWPSVNLLLLISSNIFPPEDHQYIYYSGILGFQNDFLVHDASWEEETKF